MSRRILTFLVTVVVVLAIVLAVVSAFEIATIDVGSLARHTPRRTALMREREREAAKDGLRLRLDQRWVPYDQVAPLLRHAVLVAEDDAFYSHDGLDWNEIRVAAQTNVEAGRIVRGGSTITQQLARNLYLGDERSLTRKLKEMFLALRIERTLPKRRIFELYLNEIEWGDAIFGIEAAANRYFGVSAASLNPRQSVLLAAIIINPRLFSPLHPSGRIERRARMIADRLHRRGVLDEDQYREAIGAPRRFAEPFDWLRRLFGGSRSSEAVPPAEAPVDSAARHDSTGRPLLESAPGAAGAADSVRSSPPAG